MDDAPYVYLTRWHTSGDFEPARREWFARKKVPQLREFGFRTIRAYEADAFPNGCNLYELDDLSIFGRERYKAAREADPFVPRAMENFSYNSKTIYRQRTVLGPEGVPLAPVPPVSGAVLSLLYFDAGDAGAVGAWFAGLAPGPEGLLTARLWQQAEAHPLNTTPEAEWCAVLEWERDRREDGGLAAAGARAGLAVTRADLLHKWYG